MGGGIWEKERGNKGKVGNVFYIKISSMSGAAARTKFSKINKNEKIKDARERGY